MINILNLILSVSLAASVPEPELTGLEKQTISVLKLIANDQFDDAFLSIEKVKNDYKDAPYYLSLESALYFKLTEEYRTREFEQKFDTAVEKGIEEFKKLADQSTDNTKRALYLQYLGSLYGYRGMYRSLRGEWASAFLDGRRGYNNLETSFKLDPKLIDNLSGMGTFLYWRSRKASIVKYIMLWGDKREEGINLLLRTAREGKLVKNWAQGGLLRIYIEEKKWFDALKIADDLISEYPNDIGALRRKAIVLENTKNYAEAVAIYEKIMELVKAKKFNTSNVQLETLYNIIKNKRRADIAIDKEYYNGEALVLSKSLTIYFSDFSDYMSKIKRILNSAKEED